MAAVTIASRRITALVVPPAWSDVWISPDPFGDIQATDATAIQDPVEEAVLDLLES